MRLSELSSLVKELELEAGEADPIVVLSKDAEGNSYSPLSDYSMGKYLAYTHYSGDFQSNSNIQDDNEYGDYDHYIEDGEDAIALWPIN